MFRKQRDYKVAIRGLPYLITKKVDVAKLWDDYRLKFHNAFSHISSYILSNCSFKEDVPNKTQLTTFNRNVLMGPKKHLDQFLTDILKDTIKNCGITTAARNVVQVVLSNYDSYMKRHKKKKKMPNNIKLKKNKGVRFEDSLIEDKNGKLCFPNKIKVDYVHPGTSINQKKFLDTTKKFGGHFTKNKHTITFIAKIKKTIIYQYIPIDWIGTDFNATNVSWIVLYNLTLGIQHIAKPAEIDMLEKEIKATNDILSDVKTVKGKRRYHNKLRIELHKKHRILIQPYVQKLLDMAKQNKMGLSIDMVAPGNRTWGQDKLIKQLVQGCEDQGIPFFECNPYNSSRKCSVCTHTEKDNRKTTEEFKSQNPLCKFECNSHENAARNSRQEAKDNYPV